MSVYSNFNKVDLENAVVEESKFTPDIVGAFALVAENEANYNKIMKAVGLAELACLESTGAEIVYEAADGESFINKIIKFFQMIGNKIKALFKAFINKLRDLVTNDEKFVKKYEEALKDADASKLEFEGYTFTNINKPGTIFIDANKKMNDKVDSIYGTSVDYTSINNDHSILDTIASNEKNPEEVKNAMRGAMLDKDALEGKNFDKELFKYFHNGESEKAKLTVKVADVLADIKGSKQLYKDANDAYKSIEKIIGETISNLNKLKAELKKGDGDKETIGKQMTAISKVTDIAKTRTNLLNLLAGAYLSAINANRVQAKAICVELLKGNAPAEDDKKEGEKIQSTGEGAFVHNFDNYMSNIVLK